MPASGYGACYGAGILFGVFLSSIHPEVTVVLELLASLGFENPGYRSSGCSAADSGFHEYRKNSTSNAVPSIWGPVTLLPIHGWIHVHCPIGHLCGLSTER
jgi:hypothetical protein